MLLAAGRVTIVLSAVAIRGGKEMLSAVERMENEQIRVARQDLSGGRSFTLSLGAERWLSERGWTVREEHHSSVLNPEGGDIEVLVVTSPSGRVWRF